MPGVRIRMVEADPEDHLSLVKHGTADLAINVINNMQVDDNRFGQFCLAPVPHGCGVLTRAERSANAKRSTSANFASCHYCC